MNLQTKSISELQILRAAIPIAVEPDLATYFNEKRKEIDTEIEKKEAAARWRLANDLAASMN